MSKVLAMQGQLSAHFLRLSLEALQLQLLLILPVPEPNERLHAPVDVRHAVEEAIGVTNEARADCDCSYGLRVDV